MKSPPATHLAPESFSTFYQRSTYQSLRGMNRAYEPPRGAPDALRWRLAIATFSSAPAQRASAMAP